MIKSNKHLKTFCAFLFFIICFFSEKSFSSQVEEINVEEGLKVFLISDFSNPLISISICFQAGSINDLEGKEGTAYMLSGLLNEGAGDLKAIDFQRALKEQGIRFSSDVSHEMFYINFQAPSIYKANAFKLLGLMLTDLRFDQDAIERVRKQIIALNKLEESSAKEIAYWGLRKDLFPNNPLGNKVSGTTDSINNISREDLKAFKELNFRRDNVFIGINGDITSSEVRDFLREIFKVLKVSKGRKITLESIAFFRSGINKIKFPVPQSSIFFGMPGLSRRDKDFYALYVLNHIIGGSVLSSRLGKKIREEEGLVYGINTWLDVNFYSPLWLGYAATSSKNTDKVISLIKKELKDIFLNGVNLTELEEAKSNIIGSYPLSFSTSSDISNMLMTMQVYDLGKDYLNVRNKYISSVNIDDIKRVSKRLLQEDKLHFTVVGEE